MMLLATAVTKANEDKEFAHQECSVYVLSVCVFSVCVCVCDGEVSGAWLAGVNFYSVRKSRDGN